MYLITTRSFPPEVGGMQNLMWGLAKEIILLSVDLSSKSCAFWPKSHIGVCIGIM